MTKNTIKRFSYPFFFAALSLMVTTQSCKKNVEDVQAETTTVSQERIAELKEFIANTAGVPASKVTFSEAGESFLVDNDFAVTFADAEKRQQEAAGGQKSSSSSAAQRIYQYKVTQSKVSTITIYADATVSADWVAILDQAIANWNNMGSNIHYTRITGNYTTTSTGTTSGAISAIGSGRNKKTTTGGGTTTTSGTTSSTNPNIIVTSYNDPSTSTIAYAYMPDSYGNAGNGISINNYYSYLTTAQKIFALTHEMGHSVGFTHTNGTYGNLIPGTPELDPSSIMNSTVLSWTSFTTYDVLAAKTVYPKL